jgi:hypothetical protein
MSNNNLLNEVKLREHVLHELLAIGGRLKNQEVLILCPFHNDNNASLRVHVGHKKRPGTYHCFSCNASGSYDKLSRKLQLKSFEHDDFNVAHFENRSDPQPQGNSVDPFKLLAQMQKKLVLQKPLPLTLSGLEDLPPRFIWRGLGKRFYEKFDAKLFWDSRTDTQYLYFPIHMNGAFLGYTLCDLDRKNKDAPKYQIFADTKKSFFLFDHIPTGEPIVLVEGHFDALNLLSEGINALAVFGINNWGEEKKALVLSKIPPKIVICFDGDKAGYEGAANIFLSLRDSCNVDILYLPLEMDPGTISEEYLMKLKEMCL